MIEASLTESRDAVLDISVEQAASLRKLGKQLAGKKKWWGATEEEDGTSEKSVISCSPDTGGGWRVGVANAVGSISVGGLHIVVVPKIDIRHFLYLLNRSSAFPRLEDSVVQAPPDTSFWNLVATWYVGAIESVLRRDLVRDYEPRVGDLVAARGTVLVTASADSYYAGRLRLICEFDEFDVDSPLNRVLMAAARMVAGSSELPRELRARARRVTLRMEGVGTLRQSDVSSVILDRRSQFCADAFALARHVLAAVGRTLGHGQAPARCFLFPTPDLVEEGVRNCLAEDAAGSYVVDKHATVDPKSGVSFEPDLVFGSELATADVKYKITDSHVWPRPHLYQAVTFAEAFGCNRAAVLSFAKTGKGPPEVSAGKVSVRSITWRTDLSPSEARTQLWEDVERWLSQSEQAAVDVEALGA